MGIFDTILLHGIRELEVCLSFLILKHNTCVLNYQYAIKICTKYECNELLCIYVKFK